MAGLLRPEIKNLLSSVSTNCMLARAVVNCSKIFLSRQGYGVFTSK
jgi:hypothetical protein